MRGHALAATGVVVFLSALTARAFAGDYDLKGEVEVPANSRVVVKFAFTGGVDGDGNSIVLQSGQLEFINGTNDLMKEKLSGTAPPGTKDRKIGQGIQPFPAPVPPPPVTDQGAAILPPLTPSMGGWLAANGFTDPTTFDTPLLYGDLNTNGVFDGGDVALYAENFDLDLYKPFANKANFPIGSSLTVPAGGLLYAGFRVYTDEALTTTYSGPARVYGTISEAVPEPGGAIVIGGLLVALLPLRPRPRGI
jgi:hypothetical protein